MIDEAVALAATVSRIFVGGLVLQVGLVHLA